MTTPATYDLSAVLDLHMRSIFGRMHTGMIARVVSYDATKQTVDVQPVAHQAYADGTPQRIDVIRRVPVCHASGAGYMMAMPFAQGDDVFLSFSERSVAEWRTRGDGDFVPFLKDRFALSDAVAFPLRSPAKALGSARADALVIGEDAPATGMRITIKDQRIAIGTPAVELLDTLDAFLGALDVFLGVTSAAVIEPALGASSVALKAQVVILRTAIQSIKAT